MPFGGGLAETDHVLGHELVHAFQFDIGAEGSDGRGLGGGIMALPLWFIEGMAEYLSLGPVDANTAMWIRDAAARERMPTVQRLDDPRYFPYRYGHAFWAYVAGRWGDEVIGEILRTAARGGVTSAIENVLLVDLETFNTDWHEATDPVDRFARTVISHQTSGGNLNLAPAISPDGRRIVFSALTGGLLNLHLFDLETQTRTPLTGDAFADLHPVWSPDGGTIAWVTDRFTSNLDTLEFGDYRIGSLDVRTGDMRPLAGFDTGRNTNPAFSADGRALYFIGTPTGFRTSTAPRSAVRRRD
jgi:hypothetical protein